MEVVAHTVMPAMTLTPCQLSGRYRSVHHHHHVAHIAAAVLHALCNLSICGELHSRLLQGVLELGESHNKWYTAAAMRAVWRR